jgi:hypothetical protein
MIRALAPANSLLAQKKHKGYSPTLFYAFVAQLKVVP